MNQPRRRRCQAAAPGLHPRSDRAQKQPPCLLGFLGGTVGASRARHRPDPGPHIAGLANVRVGHARHLSGGATE